MWHNFGHVMLDASEGPFKPGLDVNDTISGISFGGFARLIFEYDLHM